MSQPRTTKDFVEIAHSGGKVTFSIQTDDEGGQSFQIEFTHSGPVRSSLVGVYALPQGIPVEKIELGGIGQPWNAPPFPGCIPVLIASDSEGRFGHDCPGCRRYWRSGPWPNICPYCHASAKPHQFLSRAQLRYVRHYCNVLMDALDSNDIGHVEIDMDQVAGAAGKNEPRPSFYVSEQSQQRKFRCSACDEFNDILGRFGYCSQCGTRNDLAEFEDRIIPKIRQRLNTETPPEDCVRDAVASFESLVGRISRELPARVPMTRSRLQRLSKQRFHNLSDVRDMLYAWFDIDVRGRVGPREWDQTILMFHRRHVYEHNGGEVDQKYLDASGDTTVRLKQHIHETQQVAHNLLGSLAKLARNLHDGFHEIDSASLRPHSRHSKSDSRECPKHARITHAASMSEASAELRPIARTPRTGLGAPSAFWMPDLGPQAPGAPNRYPRCRKDRFAADLTAIQTPRRCTQSRSTTTRRVVGLRRSDIPCRTPANRRAVRSNVPAGGQSSSVTTQVVPPGRTPVRPRTSRSVRSSTPPPDLPKLGDAVPHISLVPAGTPIAKRKIAGAGFGSAYRATAPRPDSAKRVSPLRREICPSRDDSRSLAAGVDHSRKPSIDRTPRDPILWGNCHASRP